MTKIQIQTARDLVDLWPEPKISNFSRETGIKYKTVTCSLTRGRFSISCWAKIIDAAHRRGLDHVVTERILREVWESAESKSSQQHAAA